MNPGDQHAPGLGSDQHPRRRNLSSAASISHHGGAHTPQDEAYFPQHVPPTPGTAQQFVMDNWEALHNFVNHYGGLDSSTNTTSGSRSSTASSQERTRGNRRRSPLAREPSGRDTHLGVRSTGARKRTPERRHTRFGGYQEGYPSSSSHAPQVGPFTYEINACAAPPGFRNPKVDTYDGTEDPADHLFQFSSVTDLMGMSDALKCRSFPLSLKGKARRWFQELPAGSIGSFRQLTDCFQSQFISSKVFLKNSAHLMNLMQGPNETVREYMQRFTDESLQIPGLQQNVLVLAFTHGLHSGRLYQKLSEVPPATLQECMQRAHQYARGEEANKQKRELDLAQSKTKPAAQKTEQGNSKADRTGRKELLQDREFIPLNAPKLEILQVMESQGLAQPVVKLTGPENKRRQDVYCRFHREVGHDTEECRDLARQIEALIQRGYLKNFVLDPKSRLKGRVDFRRPRESEGCKDRRPPRSKDDEFDEPGPSSAPQSDPRISGTIHAISGGPSHPAPGSADSGGQGSSDGPSLSKRCRLTEELTYGPDDPVPRDAGNQGMVIDIVIAASEHRRLQVKRAYVDQGSAANILYYRVFQALGLQDSELTPVTTPLFGFTGPPLDILLRSLGFTQRKTDSQVRWAVLNTVLILRRHEVAREKLAEAMSEGKSVGDCIDIIEKTIDIGDI